MYQRISEIEFKSIKWVAVRAKPGQSLHLSPGLQRRLQFCLPNSTGLPSGKREDAQGSGDRGAWAVGGFRGFMSYQVKIYQDLSRSFKIYQVSNLPLNVSVASVVSFFHFQFVLKPESQRKTDAFRRPIIFSALRP